MDDQNLLIEDQRKTGQKRGGKEQELARTNESQEGPLQRQDYLCWDGNETERKEGIHQGNDGESEKKEGNQSAVKAVKSVREREGRREKDRRTADTWSLSIPEPCDRPQGLLWSSVKSLFARKRARLSVWVSSCRLRVSAR